MSKSSNKGKGKGQSESGDRYVLFGQTDNKTMNEVRLTATQKFVDDSINEYDRLYKTVTEKHTKFVDSLTDSETKAIDSIKTAYSNMWDEIEKERNKALGDIEIASNPNVPSASASIMNVNTSNIEKLLKGIASAINNGGGVSADAVKRSHRNRYNDTENQTDFQKSFVRISDKALEITDLFADTVVQGKESQRLVTFGLKSLENIISIVSNFRDQEKLADSVVGLVVTVLRQVLGFVTDAMMDHYNTQEEIFTNYMIYMRGTDRNIGYLTEERRFGNKLAELNLENNIRVTDLMKKSVDLASKGLSADEARSASLNNAIYTLIAPALNTSSDIFLDLQTRGMKNITDSLAGIIESVRSTAGSSRIATTAMNTIVDKLGPVELYAQKGLLSGDAAQMLSDLEQMGYATADAMEIVNTVVDAYNDPYKALSSGSTMAKLVAEQYASRNIDTLTEGKDLVLQMLDTYTSGLDIEDIVSRSAIYSTVGLNINPRFRQTTEGEPEDLAESPEDAYNRLLESLSRDDLQTFNELQTIAVTNTEMAMGFNAFVHEIGDKLTTITNAVCDIADFLVGSQRETVREMNALYAEATEGSRAEKAVALSKALEYEYQHADELYKGTDVDPEKRRDELIAQYNDLYQTAYNQGYGFRQELAWTGGLEQGALAEINKYRGTEWEDVMLNDNEQNAFERTMQDLTDGRTTPIKILAEAISSTDNWWINNSPIKPVADLISGNWGKGAKGAYLTEATPLIAGEAGPEFVIPEQKLIDTIGKGIDQYIIANNPNPDYSVIVSAMYNIASELISAINNKNSSIKLDTTTGLMSGNLNPTMGG